MPMADLARVDEYDPFDAEKFANPAVAGAIGSLATLPQRAIQNSQFAVDTGVYDPAVPVEAAMTVMGGSAVPRVPVKAGEVAVGSGPIRAYHSSPHDFDRFDLSKIGSGEGAQSYGHGLYFAENPAVSGQGGQYWQQFKQHQAFSPAEAQAAIELHNAGFDREAAKKLLSQRMKEEFAPFGKRGAEEQQLYKEHLDALDLLHSNKPVGPRTYEVNINADPAHMLDWDKPLAAQSDAVRQNLFAAQDRLLAGDYQFGAVRGEGGFHPRVDGSSGQKIYRDVTLPTRDEASAAGRERLLETVMRPKTADESLRLREAGIPGIKYLDEGSRFVPQQINDMRSHLSKSDWQPGMRSALEKQLAELEKKPVSSNYVVFDPSIVNIMKKYGIAGAAPAGMGALAATGNYQPEERN
jgi:hypothetical protein